MCVSDLWGNQRWLLALYNYLSFILKCENAVPPQKFVENQNSSQCFKISFMLDSGVIIWHYRRKETCKCPCFNVITRGKVGRICKKLHYCSLLHISELSFYGAVYWNSNAFELQSGPHWNNGQGINQPENITCFFIHSAWNRKRKGQKSDLN
jgi:hypothetical protein